VAQEKFTVQRKSILNSPYFPPTQR